MPWEQTASTWESHGDERGSVSKPTSHGRNLQGRKLGRHRRPGQGQVTDIVLPPKGTFWSVEKSKRVSKCRSVQAVRGRHGGGAARSGAVWTEHDAPRCWSAAGLTCPPSLTCGGWEAPPKGLYRPAGGPERSRVLPQPLGLEATVARGGLG